MQPMHFAQSTQSQPRLPLEQRPPQPSRSPQSPRSSRSPLRHRRPSTLTIVAVVYSIVILSAAVLGGRSIYQWAHSRVIHNELAPDGEVLVALNADEPADGAQPQMITNEATGAAALEPINVLLMGTDSRPGDSEPGLMDTMIVLTYNPQYQTLGMISLPRDLWIAIPGYGNGKINMAYSIGEKSGYPGGGVQLTKDTVRDFIGRPVDYYARINFRGFVDLVDLIDGIDVMVPAAIHDEKYPADYGDGYQTFHIDAGQQHLDGEMALKYVRTRNTDSDYGRARRQQEVILAAFKKVTRADMIPHLMAKAPYLLGTMRSSLETDIPWTLQAELATALRGASLHGLQQLVIDDRYGENTYSEEGAWILLPHRDYIRSELNHFFEVVLQPETNGREVAMADTDWVRLEVLNGTDQPGIAAATRDLLQSHGWRNVTIGDADRDDYSHTLVINYGIPEDLVDLVSSDLRLELKPNIANLEGLNSSTPIDVRIVVGKDALPQIR